MGWKRTRKLAKAERDITSLGNILIDLGYCTEAQKIAAIREQSTSMPLLGRLLVDKGVIDQEQLEHALLRQKVLRGHTPPSALKAYGTQKRRHMLNEVKEALNKIANSTRSFANKP